MIDRRAVWCLLLLLAAGCTAVDHARVPQGPRDVLVTTSDVGVPYESLGPVQATRRGVYLFGFVDPAGVNLDATLHEVLLPELRKMGADAIINVRFEQTQYTLASKIFGALFFFAPLPGEVNIRGEAIRFTGEKPR
ncbi:MAG: hypothetical protein D6729_07570 [Deltaproteobacteria bacterium]|nr:MAG: hypothetical protein D6729_07570 [Deltaproteobacteria bacterium]